MVGDERYAYYSLPAYFAAAGYGELSALPYCLRILAENLLRHADSPDFDESMIEGLAAARSGFEIPFHPARVLLQDLLGVPVMVDFAALRDAIAQAGGDPQRVNPAIPVDFVIDHSIIADVAGTRDAAQRNMELEYARNRERFAFLAWCQQAFKNFRVVPPDSGIVHQLNVERLASVVCTGETEGERIAYPDTMVCNDSHSTMVNGIGVLGWGVGGIEAESVMLGRPLSINVPEVLGVRVTGELPAGATATDLVLTITEQFRRVGVVGKFIEFYGAGLDRLPVADRLTIANMAPEYGATCVFFPVDQQTLDYLQLTGRDAACIALVKAYAQAQTLWRDAQTPDPRFAATLEVDLSSVERSLAGPRRPQERVNLSHVPKTFAAELPTLARDGRTTASKRVPMQGADYSLGDGDVIIAAITSCTNTSNPANMIAAGLLAQKAAARGLKAQPWVKTSFAPGSKVVVEYLQRAGLYPAMEKLGFGLVGFGCTTCNGNSGPLAPAIEAAIKDHQLVSVAVLSGNRNFEGRVHPHARAAYLASPPLVIAYALAGNIMRDLDAEPLGKDGSGAPVYLKDVWPSSTEVAQALRACLTPELYRQTYAGLFEGSDEWRALKGEATPLFPWHAGSTFLRRPPFFEGLSRQPAMRTKLTGLRALAVLGDMITTDHLSPNNTIAADSVAARYLGKHGVKPADFQTYGFRRGNHELALRGTFASGRLRNLMVPGTEGPHTQLQPEGKVMPIYDAAEIYRERGVPLIVFAGREYGAGSSRDWAAKGPALLGVRVVVAESFERIHRSNLVGMGVLPVQLIDTKLGELGIDGSETFDIAGGDPEAPIDGEVTLRIHHPQRAVRDVKVRNRVDTPHEREVLRHGGILPLVYRELTAA
jgi:aconitate hydratase